MLEDSVTCSPDSTFLSRHGSKGRNLALRALSGFTNQLETGLLLVHALLLAPASLEARYLVVPTGNHVRFGTLEALPVHKSNIAPVQAES